MSRSRVYQWCIWFGEGRTSLENEPKSGRPKILTNEENTTRVDELFQFDRRTKIREITLKLEIAKSTVHEIVHDTLGCRKVDKARPHDLETSLLSLDQKVQRAEFRRLRDGCRVLGYKSCDPLRNFATGSGSAAQYCRTFDRLIDAIRRKRPGLLRRGFVLQHDNATLHSANLTQQWLQCYGWEILPHPTHSPDLAPSDFKFVFTFEASFRRHGFRDRR
ncbi:histone-lysine N-methyltransferase SETMAR [Elysia marginata]|uniref:Histone-lysine N-methyltransferase SETMAR n=1 Tax=Elysia marginata TaxID=1093978 RepID=A0AAV4FXD8_9GAST|nr:histone-lysine N-methyltransferase SETMAR [Elysia marginata]